MALLSLPSDLATVRPRDPTASRLIEASREWSVEAQACGGILRSAAFEPGAAPITLISGDKLIDLMMENGIGVKKRSLESWELDEDLFGGDDEDDAGEQP